MSYLRFDKTLMTNLRRIFAKGDIADEQGREPIIVQQLLIVTHANITDCW